MVVQGSRKGGLPLQYYPIDGSVHSLMLNNLFSRRFLNGYCGACVVESDREFRSAFLSHTGVHAINDFLGKRIQHEMQNCENGNIFDPERLLSRS